MTLLEAARQALPGIAWEQVSSNGVEYVYGEGSKDSYGVFDLADIAKITAELKADRDALDADLDETPRAVLTDDLTALRERMQAVREFMQHVGAPAHGMACNIRRGGETVCDCGAERMLPKLIAAWEAVGIGEPEPLPAAPEVQNG